MCSIMLPDIPSVMAGKQLDVRMQGIVDNIIFTSKDIWVYYEIDTTKCNFLNDDAVIKLLEGMTNTFNDMVNELNTSISMHLLIVNTPVNINDWENQTTIKSDSLNERNFNKFFANQVRDLKARTFESRKMYLGIKLMNRHDTNSSSIISQIQAGCSQLLEYANNIIFARAGIADNAISDKEIQTVKTVETMYYDFLHESCLHVSRPEAEELALIAKRTFYPGMPTPFLDVPVNGRWGKGDMVRELGADVMLNHHFVSITQNIDDAMLTGYRATLTFSKFPVPSEHPLATPWFYMLQKMGLPFDMYSRFEIIPPDNPNSDDNQKTNNKKASNISSFLSNKKTDTVKNNDDNQKINTKPILKGTYRMIITNNDFNELEQTINIIMNAYASNGINLTWTSGDQQDLLLESMPGDMVRESSFMLTSDLMPEVNKPVDTYQMMMQQLY